MKEFYEFGLWQKDDHITSIGCGYGWWEVSLCLHYPARQLTLIDPLVDADDVADSIAYFTEKTGKIWETEVKLNPESLKKSNQIWVFNAWHEFENRAQMLVKIIDAIEEGGTIIIEEEISKSVRLQHEGCGKELFFEKEIIDEFAKAGLHHVASKTKDEVAIYLKFRK